MDMLLVAVLVTVLAGIPSMVLGYLIGVKQKRTLINSWDDAHCTHPKLAGQIIGCSVFLAGVILSGGAIAGAIGLLTLTQVGVSLAVAVVLPLLANFYAEMKFFN